MFYRTGENPMLGDVVNDLDQRVGLVSHIFRYGQSYVELTIEWNDDTIGIRYSRFEQLALIEREPTSTHNGLNVCRSDSLIRHPPKLSK